MSLLSFFVVSIALFTILVTLKKGVVTEKYSFFWITSGAVIVALAVFPGIAFQLSSWLGVINPANLVFFVSLFGLLIVVILLSLDLSTQGKQIRRLAEEIAILEQRVTNLEDK
jgi:hypothetical protein